MDLAHAALSFVVLLLLGATCAEGQGPQRPAFAEEDQSYYAFCLSRDGMKLAVGASSLAPAGWTIWDVAAGKRLRFGRGMGVHTLAFSPDGLLLAVGENYARLNVIDAHGGVVVWELTRKGHVGVLNHLEFTPDGRFLISCATDGMLRVWDLLERAPHAVFRFTCRNEALSSWRNQPKPLPEKAKIVVTVPGLIDDINAFSVSPDGKSVAVSLGTPEVKLFELATGKLLRTVRTAQEGTVAVRFSNDAKLLVIGGACDKGTIEVWDATGWQRVTTLKGHKHSVIRLAISPDNQTIVSAGTLDGARLWDVKTGQQKFAYYQEKETAVVGVAFLPDGKTFVTLPHHPLGSPAKFWDTATGREVSPLRPGGITPKDD